MVTIPEALAIARAQQHAGQLAVAEDILRQIIAVEPGNVEALQLLGIVAQQGGDYMAAVQWNTQVLRLAPHDAVTHYNLGVALQMLKRPDEAIHAYRAAIIHAPEFSQAYSNLGVALGDCGDLTGAISAYRHAIKLNPNYASAYNNLGKALKDQDDIPGAIAASRQAIVLAPDFYEAYNNLANAILDERTLTEQSLQEAIQACQTAIALKPDYGVSYINLGLALRYQQRMDEAIAAFRHAIELDPTLTIAYSNLGVCLTLQEKHAEAVTAFQHVVQLKPDHGDGYADLGGSLMAIGRMDEAFACYRRALELPVATAASHSSLMYMSLFLPDISADDLARFHTEFDERFAKALLPTSFKFTNERSPNRRLRIGYVSPDLRRHPVGRFMLPLLAAHNHQDFEIYAYAIVYKTDEFTEQIKAQVDVWREVQGVSDADLAKLIREDEIDILVDLSMHTAHNRLLVFARKPAPIQATYLAYCGTTGMRAIDYRFTDHFLDPAENHNDRFYSEESIYLPDCFWCYQPGIETPPVAESPVNQSGQITFGSLNNVGKHNSQVISTWCNLLQKVPNSNLAVYAPGLEERQRISEIAARMGINSERLVFIQGVPFHEYFHSYARLDIALDPFPYGGGTTTCDTLWMGVPVVTLAGRSAMSRAGASILSNVGLTELIARDLDHYQQIAVSLANDLPRLNSLRSSLRDRMIRSPLTDAPRFAKNIEAAYRKMWHRYCDPTRDS